VVIFIGEHRIFFTVHGIDLRMATAVSVTILIMAQVYHTFEFLWTLYYRHIGIISF
jgi:hypothetical protein